MNKSRLVSVLLLLVLILSVNLIGLASDLPFENYKQGLKALEYHQWDQAINYFDEIILNDLSHSDYMAKSIYLKTIMLAAETEGALELNNLFVAGEGKIPFEDKESRDKFDNFAADYQLKAKRNIDTLIGLANYLVANLPPLQMEIDKLYFGTAYNSNLKPKIREGTMISDDELQKLEEELLVKNINKYLRLTLGIKALDDYYVTTAKNRDSLHKLSKQYEVPLPLLIATNTQIEDPDKIYPNQKIYIPKITQSCVNYPAYFYYISHLSYQANHNRREDITRLVLKAYQLTNNSNELNYDYTEESKRFLAKTTDDKYEEMIKIQSKQLEIQEKEIKNIKRKYDKLLVQLQEIKTELRKENDKDKNKSKDFFEEDSEDENKYDTSNDPLDY